MKLKFYLDFLLAESCREHFENFIDFKKAVMISYLAVMFRAFYSDGKVIDQVEWPLDLSS